MGRITANLPLATLLAAFVAGLLLACTTKHAEAKPHIILMVLDDVGRTDTGIYGDSNIPVPRLKAIAKQGVIFENFYTQPVCSPTRSSVLTGRYCFRFGMQHYTVSGSHRVMILTSDELTPNKQRLNSPVCRLVSLWMSRFFRLSLPRKATNAMPLASGTLAIL